jgi:ubiquinone/menaquinone biosynthesis C-methylase UbiE
MGHVCPWWFAYTFDNPLRTLFHDPNKIFSAYVQEGMTVADIGCGMGYFSIGLARIVKEKGNVIAVDLQKKMLEILEKRAKRAGVSKIVHPHLCVANNIDINEPIDFALAFWMLHETPDEKAFLKEVRDTLTPSGHLLIAEPRFHISAAKFAKEIDVAQATGFKIKDKPKISFSYSVVLEQG